MPTQQVPTTPLNRIGLSCSGGGYRAATFHLGAMSYLNHLDYSDSKLLNNIKVLSTVSGGTITGIVYALRKQRGESFESIYHFILEKLKTVDLVKEGITKISPDGKWDNDMKSLNFINAFAELYDKELTEGKCMSEFDVMEPPLEAVCFNSTEFDNGINFRFRNSNTGRFGNDKWRVPDDVAKEVRLSDAMASSSCFTGGFEPMVWPKDFAYAGAASINKYKEKGETVGLMDGGIYDNQGVQSLLLYEEKAGIAPFDLVIVSDVTSPYMNGYEPYKIVKEKKWMSRSISALKLRIKKINRVVNYSLIGLIILLPILPLLSKGYKNNFGTGLCIGVWVILLGLLIGKMIVVNKAQKGLEELKVFSEKLLGPYFFTRFKLLRIDQLSFRILLPLLMDRVNSLYTLFMDVFLKVVRRLNYDSLYKDDKHQYRRITNVMRELTKVDYENKGKDNIRSWTLSDGSVVQSVVRGPYDTVVGQPIKSCAEEACSFGTTLWFTEAEMLDGMLDKLVACGQFTMCYNMIDYLEEFMFDKDNGYAELDLTTRNKIEKLYAGCVEDWSMFRKDPKWMVKNLTN